MSKASFNWLAYRISDQALQTALQRYASGVLLDIGCGEKQYAAFTDHLVQRYIGLDHPDSSHNLNQIDICATAYQTGVREKAIDTVLSTAVLEHLECPQEAIHEMYHILKPGGTVILLAPLFWHVHEAPRDFYRYTRYGLQYLFTTAGFAVVELVPLSGFIVTFAQELVYFLNRFRRGVLTYPILGVQHVIQGIAYLLNRWDHSYEFSWLHLLVARKPDDVSEDHQNL